MFDNARNTQENISNIIGGGQNKTKERLKKNQQYNFMKKKKLGGNLHKRTKQYIIFIVHYFSFQLSVAAKEHSTIITIIQSEV